MKSLFSILMLCLIGLVQASPQKDLVNDKCIIEQSFEKASVELNAVAVDYVSTESQIITSYLFENETEFIKKEIACNTNSLLVSKTNKSFDKDIPGLEKNECYNKILPVALAKLTSVKKHVDPGRIKEVNIFTGVNV